MATETNNYQLVKPELTDRYDLSVANGNLDKIDETLKKLDEKALIPGPQGERGPQGPKGENGKGLEILGLFGTLAELQLAYPTANPGDAYAVGTPVRNTIYIWDTEAAAWASLGQLQGPKGEAGPQGPPGSKGDQGEAGVNGVVLAADGCFSFQVSQDGYLEVVYPDENSAPDFSIDGEGYLNYTF